MWSKCILKYDPINDVNSFVGEVADKSFNCPANGALGRDGCIYAFVAKGEVLKIDTRNNYHCYVGKYIPHHVKISSWGNVVMVASTGLLLMPDIP